MNASTQYQYGFLLNVGKLPSRTQRVVFYVSAVKWSCEPLDSHEINKIVRSRIPLESSEILGCSKTQHFVSEVKTEPGVSFVGFGNYLIELEAQQSLHHGIGHWAWVQVPGDLPGSLFHSGRSRPGYRQSYMFMRILIVGF